MSSCPPQKILSLFLAAKNGNYRRRLSLSPSVLNIRRQYMRPAFYRWQYRQAKTASFRFSCGFSFVLDFANRFADSAQVKSRHTCKLRPLYTCVKLPENPITHTENTGFSPFAVKIRRFHPMPSEILPQAAKS